MEIHHVLSAEANSCKSVVVITSIGHSKARLREFNRLAGHISRLGRWKLQKMRHASEQHHNRQKPAASSWQVRRSVCVFAQFRVMKQGDPEAAMDSDSLDTPFGVAMCSATMPPSGTSHASFLAPSATEMSSLSPAMQALK
jgi:hypothetical protein